MKWRQPKVYAVQHKTESIRASSRSGGIFTAISDKVFDKKGIVYGCVLDENFNAIHTRAESAEERNRMRGSKYVQSKLGDVYKEIKNDLVLGRVVLFSGTSCQVDGLKRFLGKDYDNLICVDIVCHGVPSPKVWSVYLKWQEKRKKSKIMSVDFRNKKDFGWRAHKEKLLFKSGSVINSNIFTTLFYGHNILRPCCYECPYKSVMHPGDITIADYWEIDKAASEFDDDKGTSLVLINNDVGQELFESVKNCIKWKETRLEDSMQAPLQAPFSKPEERDAFWNDFSCRKFEYIAKKYGGAGLKNIIKREFRIGLYKIKRGVVKTMELFIK